MFDLVEVAAVAIASGSLGIIAGHAIGYARRGRVRRSS